MFCEKCFAPGKLVVMVTSVASDALAAFLDPRKKGGYVRTKREQMHSTVVPPTVGNGVIGVIERQ